MEFAHKYTYTCNKIYMLLLKANMKSYKPMETAAIFFF